ESGAMLRMAPATVGKIRERAAGLIRGTVDSWNQSILPDNGLSLGRAAAAGATKECLSPKAFLDVLDGRNTWRDREDLERHVTARWHCVAHFGGMAEVIDLVRGAQPLSTVEVEPYNRLLGIRPERSSGWKRLFGR